MTLQVSTSRFSYAGPDRIDVTRGSLLAGRWSVLAPSGDLLQETHFRIKRAAHISPEQARGFWSRYVERYTEEMRGSYRRNRDVWDELLARPRAVIVCYCEIPERCHRTLLAGMLVKLGAVYEGEITTTRDR